MVKANRKSPIQSMLDYNKEYADKLSYVYDLVFDWDSVYKMFLCYSNKRQVKKFVSELAKKIPQDMVSEQGVKGCGLTLMRKALMQ